jgi:hypothetical protein
MEGFVNRDYELKHIDEAINALQDKNSLLRTPIIELYGVGGIGKSFLLAEVERRCTHRRLPCIRVNIDQKTANFSQQLIHQVHQHSGHHSPSDKKMDSLSTTSPLTASKFLMQRSPLVLLLDAIDSTDTKVLNDIEVLLRELIEDEKLFVIVTSKKMIPFQDERSIARKLTTFQLQSLDRASCDEYATTTVRVGDPAIRNLIFEWTHGYPAAMNVMVQAINEGINPLQEAGRHTILSRFLDQVIYQEMLSEAPKEKRTWYRSALQLLSLPRRFNIVIMQDLIEQFEPGLRRENSLAYFGLPKEINEITDILKWDLTKSGFAVDTPVRNLMLLILKFEQPDYYFKVHQALYGHNLTLSLKVTGTDRIRYLRECLYHAACQTNVPNRRERLQAVMIRIEQESPEILQQFYEEFLQDDELKEALGPYIYFINATMYAALARINRQFAERFIGHKNIHFLKDYLIDTALSLTLPAELHIFQQTLNTIKNSEDQKVQHALYRTISEDEHVRELFGKDAERLLEVLRISLSAEEG